MPTPREAFQNSVEQQGYSGARLRPANFGAAGEMIGRAIQGAGQSLTAVGEDLREIQEMNAEAKAKELYVKYAAAEREQLYGENGFYGKRNSAAVDSAEPTRKSIGQLQKDMLAEAKNPLVQRMLSDTFMRRNEEVQNGIARHTLQETRSNLTIQSKAMIEAAQEDAIRTIGTPEFDTHLSTVRDGVRRVLQIEGITDPIVRQEEIEARTDTVYTGAIQDMARSNASTAADYAERYRDQMSPEAYRTTMERIRPRLLKEQGDQLADIVEQGIDLDAPVEGGDTAKPPQIVEGPMTFVAPTTRAILTSGPGRRAAPTAGASTNHGGFDFGGMQKGDPVGSISDGIVVEAGRRGGYGNQVLVKLDNGMTYRVAHLNSIKVKPGQRVTAGQLVGGAGATGTATGVHTHIEVKDASGKLLDPRKLYGTKAERDPQVMASNGGGAVRVLKPRDSLAGKLDALRDYASANDLDPEVVEAAENELMRRDALGEKLRNDADEDLRDRGIEVAIGLDANFTDPTQIPDYGNMQPQTKLYFKNWADANLKALQTAAKGEGAETDWGYYGYLSQLREENPERFAAIPASELRSKLGDTEYKQMLSFQVGDLRTGKPKPVKVSVTDQDIVTSAKFLLGERKISPETGGTKGNARLGKFVRKMQDWAVDFKESTGRAPTSEEIRRRSAFMLAPTTEGKDSLVFEAEPGARVAPPPEVVDRIRRAAPDASDAEVQRIWLEGLGVRW